MFTIGALALMMMFNVTTTEDGFNFSICGETVMANDGVCLEVGEEGPTSLNFQTSNPDHPLNCTFAGVNCIPCTSTPL
ncbi:MAG: hypothetical protein EA390_08245 [Balneolaceae bacterium]|nr:MAG: hypothetical protein EA390_08245 [Balneolaceae bacterium]